MSLAAYIAFYSSDIQAVSYTHLIVKGICFDNAKRYCNL